MNTIEQTQAFKDWLRKVKDPMGKASIVRRIDRAARGNFGDSKDLKDGVWEMRIPTGPGYRVYFTQQGDSIYLLLIGGDKASQEKDIEKAKRMAADLEKQE